MEVAIRIWRAIVEYKGVLGRPVTTLPVVKLVGALLYIHLMECSNRPWTEEIMISATTN